MQGDAEETLRLVLARLDDMKAEDTLTIDLRGKSAISDFMVVTSGRSNRHVGAVADRVLEGLHKAGNRHVRVAFTATDERITTAVTRLTT